MRRKMRGNLEPTKLEKIAEALPGIMRDLFALAGVGLIGYGAWLAWPPAGFMAAGGCLFLVSLVGSLRAALGNRPPKGGR